MRYVVAIGLVLFVGPQAVQWIAANMHLHPMASAIAVVTGAIYTASAVEAAVHNE